MTAAPHLPWNPLPCGCSAFALSATGLATLWPRLHLGDAEPWPQLSAVQAAWGLYHAGSFEAAVEAGLAAGTAGIAVANKAQVMYAHYLEPSERRKLELFRSAAERAERHTQAEPHNPNAHYLLGYALGRYAQGISLAQARSEGLSARIRGALEQAIVLQPRHADAHVALGVFHAEIIDRIGALLGRTQGVSKDQGLVLLRTALRLNPGSAIAKVACAYGMLMLEGERRGKDAEVLYAEAAASTPMDATEWLDIEMAKAEMGE
ncbi:MAG: hypothetical protein RJA98_3811 [Pseudomonadota bacterium]|jgi:hypothetical protein